MRARAGSVLVVVLGILGALAALVLGISSASFLDDRARDYKVHRARAELPQMFKTENGPPTIRVYVKGHG